MAFRKAGIVVVTIVGVVALAVGTWFGANYYQTGSAHAATQATAEQAASAVSQTEYGQKKIDDFCAELAKKQAEGDDVTNKVSDSQQTVTDQITELAEDVCNGKKAENQ